MSKNILIFTGNGKGKSTSAFGMALRAVGHNQRVLIVQFMKCDDTVGELQSLRRLEVKVLQTGLGFVPKTESAAYQKHREAAMVGFELASTALLSGQYDLIILDEICGAIARGLLPEERVVAILDKVPAPLNIVLTGRSASARLIAMADTVSEIMPIKHALDQGISARRGVEF